MKRWIFALALFVLATPAAYADCGAGQPPAGTVCAAPAGSAGVATYRLLGNGHIPSGIDAAKVGGGSVSTTEYDRLNGITTFGQSIIDDVDAAAVRTTIGTAIGTNVQAFDADLTTWAGISPSANMQSLAAAANYAAMRALLDLEAGTDFYSIAAADAAFQPLDADLTALSAAAFSRATASTASWLRLLEDTDNGTNYIEFIAPASIGTNRQCQLVDGGAPIPDSCVGDGVDDGAGGGITDIVQDTTPQLGGALDTNGFGIELGSAQTDATVVRHSAGNMSIEGNIVYRAGGTNVAIADGGCNADDAATCFANIKQVASTTATGVVELATDGEAQAKSDTARAVTPSNLAALGASTTFVGLVELATTAEAAAQTDTTRAVTPAGLAFKPESFCVAASDEATSITTGTNKVRFRMPYAFTLTAVRASVNTAPTGSTIIIDINEGGATLMTTTKLSIDASETTSTTAASAAVLTDTALADDALIGIDFDQVGSSTPGNGVKVCLIGHQ